MTEGIELQLNGEPFTNWSGLSVGLSMEHAAASFELRLEQELDGDVAPEVLPVMKGKHARLLLDGEPVVDGYVFRDARSYDADDYSITISGASRAADLIDSSPIGQKRVYRKLGLKALAHELVKDFGLPDHPIELRFEAPEGAPFERFAIEEGDTVFAALDRAARQRGLIIYSATDGALVFARVAEGAPIESLILGVNVLSASSERDDRDLFSAYYFFGQTSGNRHWHGKHAAHLAGVVTDPRMARYRPMACLEGQGPRESPEERAVWESNVRYGRSERFSYVVDGWRTSGGLLWKPNKLVFVQDPLLDVFGQRIISNIRFGLDEDNGPETEIEVCPPEAFTLEKAA